MMSVALAFASREALLGLLRRDQPVGDLALPRFDGRDQRRPDELHRDPAEDQEDDQLDHQCDVEIHGTISLASGRADSRRQLLDERIGGREPQRDADADDERRVDQAEQQEDLGLQHVHQLRLARGGLDVLARHDAHADAGAQRADTDDQATGQCDKTDVRHVCSPRVKRNYE